VNVGFVAARARNTLAGCRYGRGELRHAHSRSRRFRCARLNLGRGPDLVKHGNVWRSDHFCRGAAYGSTVDVAACKLPSAVAPASPFRAVNFRGLPRQNAEVRRCTLIRCESPASRTKPERPFGGLAACGKEIPLAPARLCERYRCPCCQTSGNRFAYQREVRPHAAAARSGTRALRRPGRQIEQRAHKR